MSGSTPFTAAPAGFISFCIRFPDQCAAPAGQPETVTLDGRLWKTLEAVNESVNRAIKFEDDKAATGNVEKIAEQERSGLTVGRFCKEQRLTEQSFYGWRKRLLEQEPMRFALVETGSARRQPATEAGLELVLATGPGTEARIAKSDIAEMRPGTLSVMPAGLDEQLSRQELADLIAFLRATRW